MEMLRARMELELSQALLHTWISRQLERVDLPVRLLRFPLGRLQHGQLRHFELCENHLQAELGFASGPALRLRVRALDFQPGSQTWRLQIEHLHFSGFRGGPVLNLLPGKVLEMVAQQANQRLPGLLAVHNNLGLELCLEPLLQKILQEAPLQTMGLAKNPSARIEHLELAQNLLRLTLRASG
ncbi:hypothetical protein [Meiothermus taiwanensis]|uniref:DUF2993 domain-containing protein n=1 Tax=Meiothermus taiwanensis TaxID=172827 RepID=A0A399E3K6_9DEIN|nr:hypothetical protein [Meiothermus taiwanensis]RIH78486.1 hypothetical protein Mcate_00808 [Meiothermus taiwanensis]